MAWYNGQLKHPIITWLLRGMVIGFLVNVYNFIELQVLLPLADQNIIFGLLGLVLSILGVIGLGWSLFYIMKHVKW